MDMDEPLFSDYGNGYMVGQGMFFEELEKEDSDLEDDVIKCLQQKVLPLACGRWRHSPATNSTVCFTYPISKKSGKKKRKC